MQVHAEKNQYTTNDSPVEGVHYYVENIISKTITTKAPKEPQAHREQTSISVTFDSILYSDEREQSRP